MELSVLKALLEAWSIDIRELVQQDNIELRIKVQKLMHLFQNKIFGADTLYSYGMYFHGPYSPELTREYYQLASALGDTDSAQLQESAKGTLGEVQSESTDFARSHSLSEVETLELLSTALFFAKSYSDKEDVKEAVVTAKPQFKDSNSEVADAVAFLENKAYLIR